MRGTVLADRYRLVDWLGGGSMGDVWLAEDEVLGRRVAVKVVKPALLEESGFAERFHAEARVMAQLRHPGIVGVYDYGHGAADGRHSVGYLVMELIDGEPLSAVLERRGALPVEETLRMALQVLEALEAAHESGVVHRDIKPANLMVRGDRTVIADFGIARPGCDARLTVPGMVLGTAAYQAPEQASTGAVTASADLYALGVVLYECLAGRLPFDGETALEVILKHLTEPAPPLPEDVPAPVWALVERAMAKEPGERWPDAATMAAAVRGALASAEGEAPRAPVRPRPVAGRSPRAGLRLRALVGVTVLAMLCVVGADGAMAIRSGRDDAPDGAVVVVAEPTTYRAGPGAPPPVEVARPLAAQESAPAALPTPSAGPGAGESPTPGATPEPVAGRTSAAPVRPDAPAPAPVAPAQTPATPPAVQNPAVQNPAPPAPTAAPPAQPAPRETATPTAPATPTQPPQPTPQPQPKPQLPTRAQITSRGAVLDDYLSADRNGNRVATYPVNGSMAQTWGLLKVSEGNYLLQSGATNFTRVLDLDEPTGIVQIWTGPPYRDNQVWSLVPDPDGYQVVNHATKQCLTSDGPGYFVRVAACSDAEGQVWTFS
ncbi:serine/threonine-protein kinase [Kitasatospora sp. SUK 42]|uniref:serine/threonine-protein kinase n=1 Tax=Kitasatospora sp. SUK 42 TaxID=1588882 RepID=UPI001C31C74F|nr:serine/threonine-protein kinase [Kitasatospora sp. SUK 42]MBV2155833.1 protein kinase [Kitasatospora sp. SUK 42]